MFLLFLILSVEEGTTLLTQNKFTIYNQPLIPFLSGFKKFMSLLVDGFLRMLGHCIEAFFIKLSNCEAMKPGVIIW